MLPLWIDFNLAEDYFIKMNIDFNQIDYRAIYEKELNIQISKVNSNGFSNNIRCPFPGHEDKNPSFAVNVKNGIYKCHGCDKKGNLFKFYKEIHGYDNKTIINKLSNMSGSNVDSRRSKLISSPPQSPSSGQFSDPPPPSLEAEPAIHQNDIPLPDSPSPDIEEIDSSPPAENYSQSDLSKKPPSPKYSPPQKSKPKWTLIDMYKYHDANGDLKYKVEKFLVGDKKQFIPSTFSDEGQWIRGLKGQKRLPYNLPAVTKAQTVFIVEGEKDVNTLTKLDLVASCNSGGANGWNKALNKYFLKKEIVIIPDNDEAGEKYVKYVAKNLKEIATTIKVVRLPDLGESEDVSDYIHKYGNTKENLLDLVKKADFYEHPKIADKKVKENNEQFLVYYDHEKNKHRLIKQNNAARALVDNKKLENFIYDYISKAWYKYNEDDNNSPKGIWVCIPEEEFLSKIITIIDAHGGSEVGYNASYLEGTHKFLKAILRIDLVKAKAKTKNLLNFQNGVLDCETMSFSSHDREYYQTSQLPHSYSPDATCDHIFKWLHEMANGADDVIKVILAFFNAILLSRSDLQKYLQVIGPGGSGKGTLMNLAVELVGEKNTYSTTFKKLTQNNFINASFYGKKLLLFPDADKDAKDLSLFKKITGNDALDYEEKYKQSKGVFNFEGMVIVSANQYVQTDDNSSAFQRRTIAVNFDKVIPQHEQIDILPELKKEIPGLINHVLSFSRDEVTQTLKQTLLSKTLHNMKIKSLIGTNPIAAWILENTIYNPDNGSMMQIGRKIYDSITKTTKHGESVTTKEFRHSDVWAYANYCKWSEEVSIKHQKLDTFREQVIDICKNTLHYNNVHQKKINNKKMIIGLQLKDDTLLAQ